MATIPSSEQVYDERGNVRPAGTPGARPMSYKQRVEIAARLAAEAATPGDDSAEDPKKQTKTEGRSSTR
jgi:hypothetical protein